MDIIRGKKYGAPRRICFGPSGIGKSTFACAEPGALALDYEQGLDHIGTDRVKGAATWDASMALIAEACSGPGQHKAVVIDTIDKLEEQAAIKVCTDAKKKSVSDFSYGEGYEAVATKWREFLFLLESAREKERAVTLVAHVQRTNIKDPMLGDYAKYVAAIDKRCWAATHRWADAVLFANYEAGILEDRALMTGTRLLYTQAGTGFDAKHRPNIAPVLPLLWNAYAAAIAQTRRSVEDIRASILKLASTPELLAKADKLIAEANGDSLRLATIESALLRKVG